MTQTTDLRTVADHVALWYDADYAEKWTVSLCEESGEEIRCVGAFEDRLKAIQAAEKSAQKYGVRGLERQRTGWVAM